MSCAPQYSIGGSTNLQHHLPQYHINNTSTTHSVQSKSKQSFPISQRQMSSNSNTHRSTSRILEHMIDTDFKVAENKQNGEYRQQRVSEMNSYRNYEEFVQHPLQHDQHIEDEQKDEEEQEYIEMVVELDSENSLSLKVRPHHNPLTLAQQFCYSQNIDPKIITPFAKQIRQMQANNWPALYPISLPTSISDQKKYWDHSQASQKSTKTQSYLNSSTTQANYQKQNDKLFSNQTNSNTYANTKSNSRVKYNAPKVYHSGKTDVCQSQNQSRVTQSNVFDRLYRGSIMKNKKQQEERVKQKVLQSHHQLRNYPNDSKESLNQSTTIFQNISSENQPTIQSSNNTTQLRIYNKNTKLQQESRLRSSYLKEQYQIMKQQQCTNHPQINPLSRLIVQKLRQDEDEVEGTYQDGQEDQNQYRTEGSTMRKRSFVRLYQQKQKSKEKNLSRIIEYMKDKEEKEMKECTFHPKILKKSQCQVISTQRHLLLHEDYYIRQNKSKTAKANEAKRIFERHHPEINQVSTELVKGRTFNERMIEYKAVADQNKEKLKKQRLSLQNHRPTINKNSKNNKKRNTSIGEHLYSKSLQKKQVKQQNHKLVVDKKSDLLYERMKINAFHQLFMDFDSDEDGLISPLKISININPEVLHILSPLLSQMEQVQIQLDQQEFINSMNRLFQTINIQQRNVIVNVTKNPRRRLQTNEQPSFNPSLNEKSIEMVKETREPGISLYQIGIEKQIEKQCKLNQLRALKAMIEFQQCTFHPNLIAHH